MQRAPSQQSSAVIQGYKFRRRQECAGSCAHKEAPLNRSSSRTPSRRFATPNCPAGSGLNIPAANSERWRSRSLARQINHFGACVCNFGVNLLTRRASKAPSPQKRPRISCIAPHLLDERRACFTPKLWEFYNISYRTNRTCPGEVLYQASDEATAQGLLRGKIPAAIGATGDLFSIDVRAFDQFGEPAFFES